MEQNRFAPARASAPEAATDEPASPVNPGDGHLSPPRPEDDPPPCAKATVPPPPREPLPPLVTDFDPAPLRYRHDGLTPRRQREYVEALADCGLAREAAARVGVSEQAVARVRRRADARAFDLACEAAQRLGARRLRSIAWERAIEGTVRRHYYHGELKSEEIVFDNRLLIYLLGRTAHLAEPPDEAQDVIDDWEPWMEAIEQGLPAPPAPEPEQDEDPADADDEADDDDFPGGDVWDDEEGWWTDFPPPAGFDGEEEGAFGDDGYRRTLSEAEQAVVDDWVALERAELEADAAVRRDAYFGFAGGGAGGRSEEAEPDGPGEAVGGPAGDRSKPPPRTVAQEEVFSSREAETTETSVQLPPPDDPALRRGPRLTAP